jgi:hypothetical protein
VFEDLATIPGLARYGNRSWDVRVTGTPSEVVRQLARMRGREPALVALPPRLLTYELLNELLATAVETETPLGFLPFDGDSPLIPAVSTHPPHPHAGVLYCDFARRFPCDVEFGSGEVDAFLRRLADGVEAMVVHAHGNGADLRLGEQVMCVQVDGLRGTPGAGDRALACQLGGPCRVEHLPLRSYWGASAVRARLAVFLSCFGYLPADGLISPHLLFASALLRGPQVEAYVASTRVTFNTTTLARAALGYLETGGTAGGLALLLNSSSATASPSYVCVGDPGMAIRHPAGEPRRHRCGAAGETPPSPVGTLSDATFLWDLSSRIGLPAETVAKLRHTLGSALRGAPPPLLDGATAVQLVLALARRGDDRPLAELHGPSRSSPGTMPCPGCEGPTVEQVVRSLTMPSLGRRLRRCGRHGVLDDEPAGGGRLTVRRDRRHMVLAPSEAGARLVAAVAAGDRLGPRVLSISGPVTLEHPGSVVALDPDGGVLELHRFPLAGR